MTEKAGDRVNVDGARRFGDWILSPDVQATIGEFGKKRYGRRCSHPTPARPKSTVKAGI